MTIDLRTKPGMIMGSRIQWQCRQGEVDGIWRVIASVYVAGSYSMVSTPVELARKRMGTELWRAHLRNKLRSAESTLRRRVLAKVKHG